VQTDNYRANLAEAIKNLVTVNESIFNSIIPVAMQGELKASNDAVQLMKSLS